MHIRKCLLLISMLLVVFSVIMATQYATTKIGYSYSIVHPSNADIRLIGGDNSTNETRLLRVNGDNSSGNRNLILEFVNVSAGWNKTHTAAFGIVNEEPFAVTISHVNVSITSGDYDYMQIWLHGNGSLLADNDPTSVFVYNNGTAYYTSSDSAWQLGCGDGLTYTMTTNASANSASNTNLTTPWDETAHVRYCTDTSGANESAVPVGTYGRTADNASDFVWVQISLDIPGGADDTSYTGTIEIHCRAPTH